MSGQRVEIAIDELVVDGLDSGARHAVADAVRRRLGELVAERGLPAGVAARAARGTVSAELPGPPARRPEALGAELAEALYRGLGG